MYYINIYYIYYIYYIYISTDSKLEHRRRFQNDIHIQSHTFIYIYILYIYICYILYIYVCICMYDNNDITLEMWVLSINHHWTMGIGFLSHETKQLKREARLVGVARAVPRNGIRHAVFLPVHFS